MAKRKRNTRQRMINLMYLVFIAMLAINYPEEVLDGFDLINEKLQISLSNSEKRNAEIYKELQNSHEIAPDKTANAYNKSKQLKAQSDSLFSMVQTLKLDILEKTDGKTADINNIRSKDNLDASSVVMLGVDKNGQKLRKAVDQYRQNMIVQIDNPTKKQIIEAALSTKPSTKRGLDKKNWEEASFESMPTIASVTYLTELQANIRMAEGEVLNNIIKEIDISDLRVNKVKAFVVPQSNIVMRGTNYQADIILAAVDSTQRPKIMVNGAELPEASEGKYSVRTGTLGKQTLKGFISLFSRDGSEVREEFTQTYTVIEPMVTIAPTLMDVLYANYDNPLSISVPGVVNQNISVSATGGRISAKGNGWVAVPAKAGQNMTISVTFRMDGSPAQTLAKTFRVRQLPDPSAFITYTDNGGNSRVFKSGAIAKSAVLQAGGITAAIDDGVLNVPFKVVSFRTMTIDAMGNASPEVTTGSQFSSRQLDQIKRMQRGKTLIIGSIKVQGPDGSVRDIYPMELRLN